MRRRNLEEKFFKGLMLISTIIIIASLLMILGSVLYKGFYYMSWEMISKTPKGGFYLGKSGGILNAIIGSLYLSTGATILAFLISFPIAIYMNIFAKQNSSMVSYLRVCFDILWGIPTIVYGAFGFILMIFFGMKTSLLAGILVISIVILPVILRTMDEVVRMIPKGLIEASYALGATKLQTWFRVVLRQSIPGIVTALLIGFGRAIGDVAAVLFTAGFTDYIPTSIFQPVATLPLAIFFQLGSPLEEVQGRGYASAFILTLIILIISILARFLSRKYSRFKI